ncbi:MAG TPA: hypothetical protein VK568_09690 [Thermodesulfobacteriota bacterium]|jgi:hypothetical protein|nr:hypothetical protein [Thermodesulfobacteriota bacterium]
MADYGADLELLAKQYGNLIQSLEKQLDEAKRKFAMVSEVIELLKKEGLYGQNKLFDVPTVLSDRYGEMSMWEAIQDILKSEHYKWASAEVIHAELLKNGFKSKSENLKRDIYSRLYRLEKDGALISRKESGVKKYSLAKKEGSQ